MGFTSTREKMKVAVLCLVMALVVVIKATPIEKDEQMKIETRGKCQAHESCECHNACGNQHCCEWDNYEGHKTCKDRGEPGMCGWSGEIKCKSGIQHKIFFQHWNRFD